MAQQATTLTRQTGTLNFFKLLWRADAAFTLIASAFVIFATSTVIEALGMKGNTDTVLRVEGGLFSLYALWQLWVAREGHITPRNFQIARFLTVLTGFDFVVAPLLLDFNSLGVALMVSTGVAIWVLAAAWHMALRENR